MARTVITPTIIESINKGEEVDGTTNGIVAATPADGFEFAMTERDDKYLLVISNPDNTNAATATIVKGDSVFGAADETLTIKKSTTQICVIDSGRFKNVSGTDKGKVVVTVDGLGKATLTLAVYVRRF